VREHEQVRALAAGHHDGHLVDERVVGNRLGLHLDVRGLGVELADELLERLLLVAPVGVPQLDGLGRTDGLGDLLVTLGGLLVAFAGFLVALGGFLVALRGLLVASLLVGPGLFLVAGLTGVTALLVTSGRADDR